MPQRPPRKHPDRLRNHKGSKEHKDQVDKQQVLALMQHQVVNGDVNADVDE